MGRFYTEGMTAAAVQAQSVDASVVEAIADWCDALHGDLPLEDAFAALAAGLGAEAGMLVRTHFSDFRPMRIAVWDRNGARSASPLATSFADGRFGPHIARPRAASVWLHSHADDAADVDPALEAWQARRGLAELAVLVLSGGPGDARPHRAAFPRRARPTDAGGARRGPAHDGSDMGEPAGRARHPHGRQPPCGCRAGPGPPGAHHDPQPIEPGAAQPGRVPGLPSAQPRPLGDGRF